MLAVDMDQNMRAPLELAEDECQRLLVDNRLQNRSSVARDCSAKETNLARALKK
jgi:hypothetical protein